MAGEDRTRDLLIGSQTLPPSELQPREIPENGSNVQPRRPERRALPVELSGNVEPFSIVLRIYSLTSS